MNDNEIRTAIAEACGWKFCPSKDNPLTGNAEPDVWIDPFGNKFWEDMPTHLPDYLNDLNAMHEAEAILTEDESKDYDEYLDWLAWEVHATARERAEAFLKTIGKWKDETK